MPGVRCNEHVLHPISTGFGYDIDLSLTFFPHTARTTGRGEIFVPLKRANGDPQFEMLDLVVSHTASTEQATAGLGSIVHDRQTICKDLVTGVKDTLGEGGVTYLTVEGHSSRLTASNNQHLGLPLHPVDQSTVRTATRTRRCTQNQISRPAPYECHGRPGGWCSNEDYVRQARTCHHRVHTGRLHEVD